MKKIEINVPNSVDEHSIKMQLAGILFEQGVLSSGQAAELVGISRRKFLETIGEYGISIFSETMEDIQESLKWLKQ
ncbi:Uncharacterized protein family (UPF0175) [Aequorivita sublithincola DSM 14238]|uniref:Uncharacterized protein family (UPF0175) n=1 Tax=Aequorivita sublithincola (strain DSM 14238 / LMG 21431 / ACAM 643 / 9-3) TaxID=746697 RepID=I3YXD5_AEQSU|nr:UPF0175 family protein [Aequorivita sublithincola]AFL81653.1 Uncharacterized protein family (UPF0175) [Aequorivita sublithincola DSM 14238]